MLIDAHVIRRGLAAAGLALSGAAGAAVVWNDAGPRDFSDDGLQPTFVSMTLGDNFVYGVFDQFGSPSPDRDYFSFTVPQGAVLSAMIMLPNTSLPPGDARIGLQSGTQFSVGPTAPDATGLLGWADWRLLPNGSDVLPVLASGLNGATGFSLPLSAGTYSVWLQADGLSNNGVYGLSFVLAPVPEPALPLLWGVGMVALAGMARRRARP